MTPTLCMCSKIWKKKSHELTFFLFPVPICYGVQFDTSLRNPTYNKTLMKKRFKEHNTYVLEVRLLTGVAMQY